MLWYRGKLSYDQFKDEFYDLIEHEQHEDETFEEAADRCYDVYEDSYLEKQIKEVEYE